MLKYRFDQIAINSTVKKKPVEEDKYSYIGLEHLDSENLIVSRWGSEVAPKGEKLLMKKGDVLFGKRRAYQKKVAIAPFDGIFSAHGMVLRPNEDVVDKRFFPMFISSDYFLDAAIAISVGSLSPTINWRDLAKLEFDLPSLDEQKKLAEVLWAINDTLQAYQKLLRETDELVKSRFIEMFGSNAIRINGWECFPLSDVLQKPMTGEWGKEDKNGTGIKVLRTTNFTDGGYIDYSEVATRIIDSKKIEHKAMVPGDILIEKSGGSDTKPVGRVVLFNNRDEMFLFNNFTSLLRKKDQRINEVFLFTFMFVTYWNGGTKLYENKTTGIHNIKLMDYLDNTKIPIPPIDLQNQFATFVQQSNKSKFALKNSITAAQATKRSLLQIFLDLKERSNQ